MLTERQADYLRELSHGPQWRPNEQRPWFLALWTANLIDIVGASVYLTEAGRRSLSAQHGEPE